jgi:hypothetical protein
VRYIQLPAIHNEVCLDSSLVLTANGDIDVFVGSREFVQPEINGPAAADTPGHLSTIHEKSDVTQG